MAASLRYRRCIFSLIFFAAAPEIISTGPVTVTPRSQPGFLDSTISVAVGRAARLRALRVREEVATKKQLSSYRYQTAVRCGEPVSLRVPSEAIRRPSSSGRNFGSSVVLVMCLPNGVLAQGLWACENFLYRVLNQSVIDIKSEHKLDVSAINPERDDSRIRAISVRSYPIELIALSMYECGMPFSFRNFSTVALDEPNGRWAPTSARTLATSTMIVLFV